MEVSVSAIIAVYNPDLSYFEKAVFSVLNQSYRVLELILVNDGGNEAFIGKLPDDPRIKVFSKQNEGVAATRNYAIKQCRGDYLAFLDQDDYWYRDKLQEQFDMIPVHGEVCMVSSSVDIMEHDGFNLNKHSKSIVDIYRRKTSNKNILLCLAEGNFIYSSTPLIHNSIFKKAGLFDSWTQPHDDWDMYLRIMIAGFPVYFYQKKSLSVWRQHEHNESHDSEIMIRSKCRVEKKMIDTVLDEDVRQVASINLLIDYLERDNLLYEKQQYKRFMKFIKYHLHRLLIQKRNIKSESGTQVKKVMSKRARRIVLRSARRYVAAMLLQ
ncbi:MAG: glycosyltransferase [Chlorobiaceae bacterium]|nr:glycosyltransferase [Chlorobiaceae bacterium]